VGGFFTVALDAVTLELFDRTRGRDLDSQHKWGEYWRPLERAAEIYGTEKFGAPLICGAGEVRQEILEAAQNTRGMGNHNHHVRALPGARLTDGRSRAGAVIWTPDATGTYSH
jgi:biotin synthase